MTTGFEARTQAVIDCAPPDSRDRVTRRIDFVLHAGATSFESLLTLAQDSTAPLSVRIDVCWLLGQLREKRAVPALLYAFQDEHSTLTWEAAKSLVMLQSKRSTKPLITIFLDDVSGDRRSAAAWTLGLLGDARAIDTLVHVLANERDLPDVRAHAAEALGHLAEGRQAERIGPLLLTALHDQSAQVRFWSAFALGSLGDPRAIPDLERLVATDHVSVSGWWKVSKEAADAIGHIRERAHEA
jgi:HEAT repeat protein